MLKDWRTLKIGESLRWYGNEFDGSWNIPCQVVEVKPDYAIAEFDGIKLTIEDCTKQMFKRA